MTSIDFAMRTFEALSPRELYDVMALRQRVFVVEQACAYLDADGRDANALHLLGRGDDGALIAYLRVLPPGIGFRDDHAIGRVVTAPEVRGHGLGRPLVREGVAQLFARAGGPVAISLAAQAHLEAFYGSLGWARSTGEYDLDGIPHVDMRRPAVPLT